MNEHFMPPCWVCGKEHLAMDVSAAYRDGDTAVCVGHDGAKEWFRGVTKLREEKRRLENGGKDVAVC